MSCLPRRAKEPVFDPMNPPRPRVLTADSSPQLRISIDRDSLMDDPEFREIFEREDDRDDNDSALSQDPPQSPLLPPTPYITPRHQYVGNSSNDSFTMPSDIQRQMSAPVWEDQSRTDVHQDRDKGKKRAVDSESDRSPTPGPSRQVRSETRNKRFSRPESVVPRVGTLTALPGATMAEASTEPSSRAVTPSAFYERPEQVAPHTYIAAPRQTQTHGPATTDSHNRKRKISFGSLKRIFTPQKHSKSIITHTTHDAAAAATRAHTRGLSSTSATASVTTNQALSQPRRDLTTPIFADHPDDATSNPRRPPRRLFGLPLRPLRTPGPRKSTLHRVIIQLRGRVSDLTLENQVLREQIQIVRQDWHETARELDLERMKNWEAEMDRFNVGVALEEARTEIGRLKRGSLA